MEHQPFITMKLAVQSSRSGLLWSKWQDAGWQHKISRFDVTMTWGTMRDHGCIVRSDINPFHICWLYSFHFISMGYNCQPIENLPTLCLLYLHFCFVARGPFKTSLASLDGNTTLLKRKWTIQFQETGPVLYDEFGPSGKCHVHVGDESRNKFDASIGRLALQAPSILYALGFRGWKWEKTFV